MCEAMPGVPYSLTARNLQSGIMILGRGPIVASRSGRLLVVKTVSSDPKALCAKPADLILPAVFCTEAKMSDEDFTLAKRLRDRALSEVGTHAVVLLDPTGVIVGWLAGAERLFGYKADEIIGQDVSRLFTPEDLEKDLSSWETENRRSVR